MEKEKMFDVVIGVNWSVPARTAEEAIKKAQIIVSQKGFGYRPSCCTAEVEKMFLTKKNNMDHEARISK